MSANTGISWTDRTWNPVVGCTKVSQGCKNCYAKTLHDMRHRAFVAGKLQNIPQYAEPFETVQTLPGRLTDPLGWRKPSRVFVNSVSDLFHDDVSFEFIATVFAVMALARLHAFQILTKRPARMLEFFRWVEAEGVRLRDMPQHDPWGGVNVVTHHAAAWLDSNERDTDKQFVIFERTLRGVEDEAPRDWPLDNVWLGVSVENQEAANERIPLLVQTPAAVRFLSCEPLLGPIDFYEAGSLGAEVGDPYAFSALRGTDGCDPPIPGIDWVIVGGESGTKKQHVRPMHPQWVRSIRDQCAYADVAFHFKQWGDWVQTYDRDLEDPDWRRCDTAIAETPNGEWLNVAGGQGFHGERLIRVNRVGVKRAGRSLDGIVYDEFPDLAAVRP